METTFENFNTRYTKSVLAYIDTLWNTQKIIKSDGSEWVVFLDSYSLGYCFLIRPARKYSIPPKILELLKIGVIQKQHAETIYIGLQEYVADWDDTVRIDSFCGIPWTGARCSRCRTADIFCGKWIDNNKVTLCTGCYMGNKGFRYVDMTDFNVADWLVFSDSLVNFSRYYLMLVNCNPDSIYYEKIMLITTEDNAIIIGDASTLDTYISRWFSISGNYLHTKNVLDMECINDLAIQNVKMYNVFPHNTQITFRMLLENRHVLKGDNIAANELFQKIYGGRWWRPEHISYAQERIQKEECEPVLDETLIDSIYKDMEKLCMYSNLDAAYFYVWLSNIVH